MRYFPASGDVPSSAGWGVGGGVLLPARPRGSFLWLGGNKLPLYWCVDVLNLQHVLCGWYRYIHSPINVAMRPEHEQVLLGLGAALLSDDSRTASGKSYRPVDLRRTMATLVIQRALKRNVGQNRSRHLFANVVLAAREQQQVPIPFLKESGG